MDRLIVYPGAIPLDTDILSGERNAMIALGFLAQGAFGTGTQVWGLGCGPTSPASMSVLVAPGAILLDTVVDQNAFGSLAADTSDALVKIGINLTSTSLALTAPSSSGQSINYLVEAAFLEQDTDPVVLPYYNASNPAQPYSGPANSAAAQNTLRSQSVQLQAKAGTPANTGTQMTPAVDSGWTGLYVVTVAYAATTVVSGNIVTVSGAPFVGGGSLISGRLINVQRWATHGSYTHTPALGVNSVIYEVMGSSGSSGGVAATGSTDVSISGGGASGSYAKARVTSGFAGAAVTVGQGASAPGAGNNNGSSGGASSVIGSFGTISAPGGGGSLGGAAYATGVMASGGTPGAAPTISGATTIVSAQGDAGSPGICINVSTFYGLSGQGGASAYGEGGEGVGENTAGVSSATAGAGPSGSCSFNSGGAQAGGAGTDGVVTAWEFT